ncbi:POC1 centriolar protein A [Ceratobasidium sp. 392]|nr:POC1 centriolar protein A [Ceratobasidium sp. 392]
MSGTRRVLSATGEVAHELLRLTAAAVDVFPPLKDAAGVALCIADLVKHFRSNRDPWRDLGAYVTDATASIIQSLAQVDGSNEETKSNVEKLKNSLNAGASTLVQVERRIGSEKTLPWHKRATRFLDDLQLIENMRKQVDDKIALFELSSTIITMVSVEKALDAVIANGKTLSAIAQETSVAVVKAESISRKASRLGLNATLEKLPRAHSASWDSSRGCMENTRVELVDKAMAWVDGPTESSESNQSGGAQIMLLTAVAGAGKSTIAHTIARKCYERGQLGSSFFDRETHGRSKPALLFTTIAADLSRLSASLSQSIASAIENDRSLPLAPLSRQFEDLVVKPCRSCPIAGRVAIVIDALDEAWDRNLLEILRDRVCQLPDNFCIFLTSRMRPELVSLTSKPYVSEVMINLSDAANTGDIARYAPWRLRQLAEDLTLGDGWPGEPLQSGFITKADGLFLWVSTVCNYLYSCEDPTEELRRLLSSNEVQRSSAADRMNGTYIKILESFNWSDDLFVVSYRRVMGTAIASKTPLTVAAMKELYHLASLASDLTLQRLSPLLTGMQRDDQGSPPVRVLHQSLREFVVVQTSDISSIPRYKILERRQSQELACLCLDLMNRELNSTTPGTGFLTDGDEAQPGMPTLRQNTIPEALRYACLFWQSHLGDTDWSREMEQKLTMFLDQKVVLWMEMNAVWGRYSGLSVLREWVQKAQVATGDDDAPIPIYNEDFAVALQALYYRLQYEDRLEEALEASKEVVLAYRHLTEDDPKVYMPELANSLKWLSVSQSSLGNHTEALAAAEEAVKLIRQLASDHPSSLKDELSSSLHTISNRLSSVGRHKEALASIEEAVQLRRQLAADRPATFTPDLALSLNNLSIRLSDFGRYDEALAAIEETVQLYRQLAADRPDAFTPDLAISLNNLSIRLSDFGRHDEALAVIEEAVQLRRQLAADRPGAFTPDLAMSLYNLARSLSNLSRHEESLAPIQEAIELRRKLAADRPAVFTSDLADSLNNLSYYLSELGRHEEALAASREAVPLYRWLADDRPLVFNASLKRGLTGYSICLRNAGHPEEAAVIDMEIAGLPS